MAKLTISEYDQLPQQTGGIVQCGIEPSVAVQEISFTGTPGTSAAFNAKTKFVRVHTDGICGFRFGTAPTAATTDPRMPADHTEIFGVTAGASLKISVITKS